MAAKSLMFVDYENVQQVDISAIPGKYKIVIFVGANQKSIPVDRVVTMQKYGSRVTWHPVVGLGKNALDFYIAYYLGMALERDPDTDCLILSKDKGYDPLVKHLCSQGRMVSRINSVLELNPSSKRKMDEKTLRVIEVLTRSPKSSRPRKRATLERHISASIFRTEPEVQASDIIDQLFACDKIAENAGQITYSF